MFQSFTAPGRPEQGPPRLALLREAMATAGLDALLVPRADAHQGEYVAPCDARLAWLTGFSGSAGFCIVTAGAAAILVDGRYRMQVLDEVAADFTPLAMPATRPADWLRDVLTSGARVGFDPWLHTPAEVETLRRTLDPAGIALVATDNLIDRIWTDRPGPPMGAVTVYPDDLAGATHAEKRARIAAALGGAGHRAAVLTQPDSIAWLLNIRGADLPRLPVAQGFAVIHDDARVALFMAAAKLDGVRDHLGTDVAVLPPEGLTAALATLPGPVRVDPATVPVAVVDALEAGGVAVARGADPVALPKAAKSEAEIAATRNAHLRDGAAMCAFLAWLEDRLAQVDHGSRLTETDVVCALERFRRQTDALRDIAFDTIAGAGAHGAIVHYRVTEATDRAIAPGDLLLVDSGGQYIDGTTDITRTVAVGPPTDEQRVAFTRVLQGMIAISRARFPVGVAGCHLDALARAPLWMAGQDYDHGTGHGVGVYLSVHEGPQRLARTSDVPLAPGMILSNEPGYYRDGAWGIRIENLVVVQRAETPPGGDPHREMLAFETLTWVPIDRALIEPAMLSRDETAWLDAYHATVARHMAGRVDTGTAAWLDRATAPLA